MRCLQVELNGALLWRVGIDQALMYSLLLGMSADGEVLADIYASGMYEILDGRKAHAHWGDFHPIKKDDRLVVTLVESEHPTPPTEIAMAEDLQRQEAQMLQDDGDDPAEDSQVHTAPHRQGVQLHCAVNGQHQAIARMGNGENRIQCSLLWNRWHPDRCRVHVHSFGEAGLPESDWLRVDLATNDSIEFLTTTV
ncbi:hypothetical protein [Comamonas sp. B-9]|uniref:hypothetical protein n=1 Tax=Comamonas sp. B-9 TaxID=1055192 RepID=UPI0011DC8D4C|nr:hypothetical protein [Comamonas sp. B-9]